MSHGSSYAEEPEAVTLEPVVVSASAYPMPSENAPASVTIITREEIEQKRVDSLTDLLREVPGLYVDQAGTRGGLSSAYIRGGDPNFTAVFFDGVQVNDPTNPRGGSVDLSLYSTENIERIEILKGPASALYGSDAVSGVINIITRKAGPGYRAVLEGGDPGHVRGLIQASGRESVFDYSLSASATRTGEEFGEGPFRMAAVGGSLGVTPRSSMKFQFNFQVTGTDVRAFPDGSGGPRLAVLRETEHRTANDRIFGLRLDHTLNTKWDYQLTASLHEHDQSVDSPGVQSSPGVFEIPPSRFETRYRRIRIAWRNLIRPFDAVQLAAGVEQTEEKGNRSGTGLGLGPLDFERNRGTSTFFTEVTGFLPRAVTLIGGVRGDFPDEFKREVSPRVGINFRPLAETRLHASYGQGFKLPSFYALSDPLIGNPGLTPETSSGWDVGVQQGFWNRRIVAGISYFSNVFHGLIDFDPGLFQLVNRHEVRIQGVELETSVHPISGLTLRAHGTYLDTEIVDSDEQLRNRPKFSGGFGLDWSPHRTVNLKAEFIAASKRFDFQVPTSEDAVAGFSKINLAITAALVKNLKLYARIDNLLNRKYEEFIGFPAPGLHVKGGLDYLF